MRENEALWRQIEQGLMTMEELRQVRWKRIFRQLDIDFDGAVFERYFRDCLYQSAIVVDGAREMLEALTAQDLELYAASNGPEEQQKHRLSLSGLVGYFKDSFISEAAGASKPERAFFDYAFSKINASRREPVYPQEAVIIGDSLTSDMAGGRAYGLKTCYYQRAGAPSSGGAADITVQDLRQVASRLKDLEK